MQLSTRLCLMSSRRKTTQSQQQCLILSPLSCPVYPPHCLERLPGTGSSLFRIQEKPTGGLEKSMTSGGTVSSLH